MTKHFPYFVIHIIFSLFHFKVSIKRLNHFFMPPINSLFNDKKPLKYVCSKHLFCKCFLCKRLTNVQKTFEIPHRLCQENIYLLPKVLIHCKGIEVNLNTPSIISSSAGARWYHLPVLPYNIYPVITCIYNGIWTKVGFIYTF